MHEVSQTYKDLFDGLHDVVTVAEIETEQNGATVYEEIETDGLYSVSTSGSLFPDQSPSIGNFCAREADITFIPPSGTIPRMARIRLFVYLTDGETESERIPKGTYYIDTRSFTQDKTKMTVHCYDAALKFDEDFSASNLAWPAKAEDVVQSVAASVGVQLAPNVIGDIKKYTYRDVPLITNITKRELLSNIACMFAANFAMDDNGRLQMYPLNIEVEDVGYDYLADENGNIIVMGGDYIVV